jgi:hypothetical protein
MRTSRTALILFAVLLTVPMLSAQDACPCVPLTHLWVVKTCADWQCAATELAVANGDPQVIAVPVGMNDGRWLVVHRYTGGAVTVDPTDPFQIEQFDGMTDGAARFAAIGRDSSPLLLTAPDGHVLVMSLKPGSVPRRRAAGH